MEPVCEPLIGRVCCTTVTQGTPFDGKIPDMQPVGFMRNPKTQRHIGVILGLYWGNIMFYNVEVILEVILG